MKKKGAVVLLVLIVIVAWWWVMTGSGADDAPQPGVLDVWVTWGDKADGLQAFFDGFGAQGALPVKVRTRLRSDDILQALSGAGAPDLVILSSADLVRTYHQQGLLQRLAPRIDAAGIDVQAIYPALLEPCTTPDGELLCLPWGGDVEALWWNKDLFAAAGLDPERPPQTMEELAAYAAQLTVRDEEGDLQQVGFIPDLPRSHMALYAAQRGGSAGGAETLAATTEAIAAALQWQRRFYEPFAAEEIDVFVASLTPYMSSTHPTYGGKRLDCRQCHRATAINKKTPDTVFLDGHVAMIVDGQWPAAQAAGAWTVVNAGVAPFPPSAARPQQTTGAAVQGPVLVVPAGAGDKEAVMPLLAWMMSPARLADAANANGFLPASREAAQDPRFQQNADLMVFLALLSDPQASGTSAMADRVAFNSALAQLEKAVLHEGAPLQPLVDEFQKTFALRREEALGYENMP